MTRLAPPAFRRADLLLPLLAVPMLATAALFARRYPLAGHAGELTDIGILAGYGVAELVGYVGGVTLLFSGYAVGLRVCRRADPAFARRVVWAVGMVLVALFALMYPVNAIDLFIYAVRSRIFTAHGVNPQTVPPVAFPDDPLMTFASAEWADDVSPYGPLWTLAAAPVTALAGDDLGRALVGYKLLAVAAILVGGWLAAAVAATADPARAPTATLAWLWNPLVLWEGAGNGHNDVLLAVPLLLAMLAWARRRDGLVLPSLAAASALKYVALPLLPLAVAAAWRRGGPNRVRVLAGGAVAAGVVGLASLAPFFDPAGAVGAVAAQGELALLSPAWLAILLLRAVIDPDAARLVVRVVSAALFLGGLWLLGRRLWRDPERFPRIAFESLSLFLAVATWNFRPWYLIWLVALAAPLPGRWPLPRTNAWAAGGLAGYAVLIWLNPLTGADRLTGGVVATLLAFVPPAAALLLEWRERRYGPAGGTPGPPTRRASSSS